jgi:hypothetical protein
MAFQGSIPLGMGFTFDDTAAAKGEAEAISRMERLLEANPHNADVIRPYIGGEEVNNSPTHSHHRYVIDFDDFPLRREPCENPWSRMSEQQRRACLAEGIVPDDYDEPVAADWPDLLAIAEALVRPQRLKQNDRVGQKIWWRFLRRRGELFKAIGPLTRVLVSNCGAAPHLAIAQLPSRMVFANTLAVIAFERLAPFACLQSRAHEVWARSFASSMKDDLRYTPTDCFETFPFPSNFETLSKLEAAGRAYHDHRAALMIVRNEGMTKTYNCFHDPAQTGQDIRRLRDLHAAMDRAVFEAYGWRDLAGRAAPIFLDESNEDDHAYQGRLFWPPDFRDEVLARLLALNAERHSEEVRLGIAPGMKDKRDDGGDKDAE